MDISDFPKPHIPPKLPISDIMMSIMQDPILMKKAFDAVTQLSGFIGYLQNLPNPSILISSLTLQESVLSSKIEGTIATISDVVNDSPESETIKNDIVEINNYVNAINYGSQDLKDREFRFSSHFIRSLHMILMENNVRGANKTPGKFKTEQNYISNSYIGNFTPLPPYLTDEYIENLVNYMNDCNEISPIFQAGIVHAQFEMIHPFQDGNGRIGRLLIPLLLYAKQFLTFPTFFISRYFEAHDNDYKKCLSDISRATENDDLITPWKNWFIFLCEGITEQGKSHISTAKKIINLSDEIRMSIKRTDQMEIIDYLFENLYLEPAEFKKNSTLPDSTIYNVLKTLSEEGFIKRTGSARKTRYVFSKLVDML